MLIDQYQEGDLCYGYALCTECNGVSIVAVVDNSHDLVVPWL